MTREEEDALSDVEWMKEQIKNAKALGFELPPLPEDNIYIVRKNFRKLDAEGSKTFGEIRAERGV